MTRWIAYFEDNPEAKQVREDYSSDHLGYLQAHRDQIMLPGGLRPEPGARLDGGLWVMEVNSRDEAVRLCENDPYFRRGLRKGYRLHVWGKAFPDSAVTL